MPGAPNIESWRLHKHIDCAPEHLTARRQDHGRRWCGRGRQSERRHRHTPGRGRSVRVRTQPSGQRNPVSRPGSPHISLDYAGWDEPEFAERAVRQIEEGHRLGAAGFKEFKRLGLYLRDQVGRLIKVDHPKLDPMWRRCGELGMPVSIYVADPKAFWLPYDDQ